MRRRHNRLLHSWGIADGFTVTRGGNNTVLISPGTAIDKNGNEIVLLDPVTKDLSAFGADKWIWLRLRYRQELTDTIQGGATRWAERPTIEADATLPAEDGSVIVVGKIWTDAVGGPSGGIKGIYPDRRKPAGLRADAFVQGLTVSSVPLNPPAGANTLDVQRVQRTNPDNHPKNLALYVTSDSAEAGDLVEFRHSDGTRGIGFGTAVKDGTSYARICAAGSAPDQHLSMVPKGKGEVTFVGNTYAGGDLTVVRNAFLKKSLTVEDAATLKKTLTVADTATFEKSLTVADTTTLQKSLTITGGQATQITAEANTLDVQRVKREYFDVPATNVPRVPGYKGEHPTGLALYVTGTSDEAGKLVEFRNSKGTEGIGFGHNTIYATGSDPNQPLRLRARGTGRVEITQENWLEVTPRGLAGFKDGWANWGVASEFNSVGYFKDSLGVVHLKGLAKWTKSTANANDIAVIKAHNVIFTLFPGYRPEKRHVYAVASGEAPVACRIDVGSSGDVTIMYETEDLYKTAAQYASLDGISFKAA
jgi:hypothetical protein